MTDIDARKDWNDCYNFALNAWQPFLSEAQTDLRFYGGDQWDPALKSWLKQERREALVWNKIRRIVHLVGGYQRKNRLSLKVDPVGGADVKTASQLSAIVQWIMQRQNAYNILSDAFTNGALKTGINLVNVRMSFNEDPISGDVRFYRCPYNLFLLDPNMSERDLSDCDFILRRKYLSKQAVKALLPNVSAREIDLLSTSDNSDGKFNFFSVNTHKDRESLLRYDEHWKREFKKTTFLVDTQKGNFWKWKSDDKERLLYYLRQYPQVRPIERMEKAVRLVILVEDQVFYDGPDPDGLDDYPFVPIMGQWDPEEADFTIKCQGLVRPIRDPQTEYNKRRCQILDIMGTQLTSGWMHETGTVDDPALMYQTGQGRNIVVKDGKLPTVKRIDAAEIPAGFFQIAEQLDRDIQEIPGANSELFGMPEHDNIEVAGFLAKLRQGQGLTVLQDIFDNYRLSKKLIGSKVLRLVQLHFQPDKVSRIIEEPPTKEFYDRDFGKYDCVPVEGVLSDSQRQQYFMQLLSLKKFTDAPIPWSAMMETVPIERKDELEKAIQAAEEKQAQAQQVQAELLRLEIESRKTKIASEIASIKENTEQAAENRAGAMLDQVKTMKELQGMDLQRIIEGMRFLMELGQMMSMPTSPSPGQRVSPPAQGEMRQ